MSFFFFGYRALKSADEIRQHVIKYIHAYPELHEDIDGGFLEVGDLSGSNKKLIDEDALEILKIFSTSLQQTWLVATPKRIYCVLDDIEKKESVEIIKWHMTKLEFIAKFNTIKVRNKSDRTGIIDFTDKHQAWLYSKNLFENYEDGIRGATASFSGATFDNRTVGKIDDF